MESKTNTDLLKEIDDAEWRKLIQEEPALPSETDLSKPTLEELTAPLPLLDATTLPNNIRPGNCLLAVSVYVYKNRLTGQIHRIEMEAMNPNEIIERLLQEGKLPEDMMAPEDMLYSEHPIHSEWAVPNSKQFDRIREESSIYTRASGTYVLHPWRLKQRMIRYCLIRLDVEGVDVSIETDDRGRRRLTEDSEERLGQLHPSIIDFLYEKFTILSCLG